jgi:hypothetical protein
VSNIEEVLLCIGTEGQAFQKIFNGFIVSPENSVCRRPIPRATSLHDFVYPQSTNGVRMTNPADLGDPLNLPYPSGKTTLMQHLQTLVLRGNAWWVGGISKPEKLVFLVTKLSERYPLTRGERGRTYDRSKGLAAVRLVVYPTTNGVAWWLLSSDGKGGLADPSSADHKSARHAKAAGGHIEFEDYVLLYAHKKDARTLLDARTGRERKVIKDCSTWTWKLTSSALNEARAALSREVAALNYGDDTCAAPYGLRGFLAFQRRRPLFSGVRTQVLELHREAASEWGRVRPAWVGRHTRLAQLYGANAGALRPLSEITSKRLPKMGRFKVFQDKTRTVRTLTARTATS